MFTKTAYARGIQSSLVQAGRISYATEDEAVEDLNKIASAMIIDPAFDEVTAHHIAEIMDGFSALRKSAATLSDGSVWHRAADYATDPNKGRELVKRVAEVPAKLKGKGMSTAAKAGLAAAGVAAAGGAAYAGKKMYDKRKEEKRQAALTPLERLKEKAESKIRELSKRALDEGLASRGADGAPEDTNARAGYDVSGNGDSSSPAGRGSTTVNEMSRAVSDHKDRRLASDGAAGVPADTNARADHEVSGNGQSSMAERQTTADELKVACAVWGPYLAEEMPDYLKIATIREIARSDDDDERAQLVQYANTELMKQAGSEDLSDEDILSALSR